MEGAISSTVPVAVKSREAKKLTRWARLIPPKRAANGTVNRKARSTCAPGRTTRSSVSNSISCRSVRSFSPSGSLTDSGYPETLSGEPHSESKAFGLPNSGFALATDRGHGSTSPSASDPGFLGHDHPDQPDRAGHPAASSSRSTGRRADARSLRSARELLFRSREAPDCRRRQDPRPRRGVVRSCSRPDDRSEVSPPGSRPVYDGLIKTGTQHDMSSPSRRRRPEVSLVSKIRSQDGVAFRRFLTSIGREGLRPEAGRGQAFWAQP